MPVDPSILFQSKIPEYQDPLAQAGRAMSLSEMATGNQLKQYMLQQQQRKDTATQVLGQVLPALQAGGYSDEAVSQVLKDPRVQASPDSMTAVMDMVNQQRKAAAAAGESEAKAQKERVASRAEGLKQVGGMALSFAQSPGDIDPMAAMKIRSLSKFMGFDPEQAFGPMPADPAQQRQWFANFGQGSMSAADQLQKSIEIGTQANVRRGQDLTADTAAKRLQFEREDLAQKARIADPFGIFLPQPGGGGGGGGAPPDVPAGGGGGGMPSPVSRGTYASQPSQPLPTGWQPGQPLPPIPAGYTQQTTSDGIPVMAALGQQFGNQGAGFARAAPQAAQVFTNLQGATPQQLAAVQADQARSGAAPVGPSQSGPLMSIQEAMRNNVTGEDFLQLLPPAMANKIRNIAAGREHYPTGPGARSPQWASIDLMLHQAYPDFDATTYESAVKTERDFAGGGKNGNTVASMNRGVAHMGQMLPLMDALQNGDLQLINRVSNAVSAQTGLPAVTNFNAAKQIVGNELVKAIVGAGGTGEDRNKAQASLDAANSPEQLKGVINTYIGLLGGQLDALRQQYQAGTNRNDFDKRFLLPETRKALEGASMYTPQLQDPGIVGRILGAVGLGGKSSPPAAAPSTGGPTVGTKIQGLPLPKSLPVGIEITKSNPDGTVTVLVNNGTSWDMKPQ